MIIIWSVADERKNLYPHFCHEKEMGKKFPSKSDAGTFNAKCSDNIFHLRRRSNGEYIKKEKKSKDWNKEDFIPEKKDNKG